MDIVEVSSMANVVGCSLAIQLALDRREGSPQGHFLGSFVLVAVAAAATAWAESTGDGGGCCGAGGIHRVLGTFVRLSVAGTNLKQARALKLSMPLQGGCLICVSQSLGHMLRLQDQQTWFVTIAIPLAHFCSELASLAGGQDAVQEPGDPVERITWDQVRACEPEVLVLIPGSISSEQTLHEIGSLATLPGWWSLPAVQAGDVFLCDHVYYTRPGPRVVQGVEVLAGLLHPDLFPFSPPYNSVRKLTLRNGQRCRPRQLATYFEPCT